jgi:hypothetical protein
VLPKLLVSLLVVLLIKNQVMKMTLNGSRGGNSLDGGTSAYPSDLVVDDLVTTSSIVGNVDEFADANTSDISIDLDVDATNQHDELDEKHGTDGEDNCILEVLDLLEDCCEGEDEMPELHESSSDGEEPREGRAVMVEFTKLKLMLMKSEPDVHFVRRCKKGMVLVDSVDDTLGGVSKNSFLKPKFPTALQQRFVLKGVENPESIWWCGTVMSTAMLTKSFRFPQNE